MSLPLSEVQVVNDIASLLYSFLPGKPHPYADQSISFAGIARDIGLYDFWPGGSKLPAVTILLKKTLEFHRGKFCKLMIEIVNRAMIYRNNKGNPITREEIRALNSLIERVHFKIPELRDPSFIDSLPSSESSEKAETVKEEVSKEKLDELKKDLLQLDSLDSQARGYAFEKFLKKLFSVFGLEPHSSFRLIGEQIDGSLQLDAETYLIEAKWQKPSVGNADLLTFHGKVEGKATWSRGIFISYSGFTDDGIKAFSRGRATNIIAMNGQDLFFIIDGKMSLVEALRQKTRYAAETGRILITVQELSMVL